MTIVRQWRAATAAAGLAVIGVLAMPETANAWWRGGYGYGIWVPPVYVAPPPVYYAPPPVAYVAPPVAYAAPPVAYPAPPPRVWVPPHWEGGYWVRGHWA